MVTDNFFKQCLSSKRCFHSLTVAISRCSLPVIPSVSANSQKDVGLNSPEEKSPNWLFNAEIYDSQIMNLGQHSSSCHLPDTLD